MRFNLKKDDFDERDHLFPLFAANKPLPNFVTMLNNLGPVRDQGQMGSCTGQASGGFLDWLYNTQKKYFKGAVPENDFFSALYIYAQERLQDKTFPSDAGSASRTAFRVLSKIGACLNSQMPYLDTEVSVMPTAEQMQAAIPYDIGAYHRILWDTHLEGFRSCLASGYCRIIGIPVYEGIESDECAQTGRLPIPRQTDTPIGGHEMLVFGYSDHHQCELVRNSWGTSWGVQGNLTIPYGYYEAVGHNDTCDSWTAHMGRPWVVPSKKKITENHHDEITTALVLTEPSTYNTGTDSEGD